MYGYVSDNQKDISRHQEQEVVPSWYYRHKGRKLLEAYECLVHEEGDSGQEL